MGGIKVLVLALWYVEQQLTAFSVKLDIKRQRDLCCKILGSLPSTDDHWFLYGWLTTYCSTILTSYKGV